MFCFVVVMFLSRQESAMSRESSTSSGMHWPGDSQRSAEAHLRACFFVESVGA